MTPKSKLLERFHRNEKSLGTFYKYNNIVLLFMGKRKKRKTTHW